MNYITTLITPKGKSLKFTQKQIYRIRKRFNLLCLHRLIRYEIRTHKGWYLYKKDYEEDHKLYTIYDETDVYQIMKKDLKSFLYKYSPIPSVNNFLTIYGTKRTIYGLFSDKLARDNYYKHINTEYIFYDQHNTYKVNGADLVKFGIESGYDPDTKGLLLNLINGKVSYVKGLFMDKQLMDNYYNNLPEDDVDPELNPCGYKGAHSRYVFKNGSCGHTFEKLLHVYRRDKHSCPVCNVTKQEKFIIDTLKDMNIEYIQNDWNLLECYELDIYIPHLRLAIEVNGLAYHSSPNCLKETIDPNKHYNKYKMCKDLDIELWQFTDTEINSKPEVIKSMLMHRNKCSVIKIDARRCVIRCVEESVATKFMESNNIELYNKSLFTYGLYFNDDLLSIMSVNEHNYIINFCIKTFHNIRGGFSKLLTHIMNKHNIHDIYAISDNLHSQGNVYKRNGFEFDQNIDIQGISIYSYKIYIDNGVGITTLDDNKITKYHNAGRVQWRLR